MPTYSNEITYVFFCQLINFAIHINIRVYMECTKALFQNRYGDTLKHFKLLNKASSINWISPVYGHGRYDFRSFHFSIRKNKITLSSRISKNRKIKMSHTFFFDLKKLYLCVYLT